MPQFELPKIVYSPLVPDGEVWLIDSTVVYKTMPNGEKLAKEIDLRPPHVIKLRLLKPEQEG